MTIIYLLAILESRQQLLNLKRKSVGLKHQNLSSSEDEAPNQRSA